MTGEQLHRLRTLLAGRLLFPEARALALTMLKIHERRMPGNTNRENRTMIPTELPMFLGVFQAEAMKSMKTLELPNAKAFSLVTRSYLLAAEVVARPEDDPDPASGPPTMGQLAAAIVGNTLAAAEAERNGNPAVADRLLAQAKVEVDRMRAALTGAHSVKPLGTSSKD